MTKSRSWRTVGLNEHAFVVVVAQVGVVRNAPEIAAARSQPDRPLDAFPPGQAVDQMVEMGLGRGCRRMRLDHDVQVTATGQPQLFCFLFGFAVAKELRTILGKLARGQLLQQVVLDTAARQRALDVAGAIAGEQRPHGSRRRTVGRHHGGEPAGLPPAEPIPRLTEHLLVDALHPQNCSTAAIAYPQACGAGCWDGVSPSPTDAP